MVVRRMERTRRHGPRSGCAPARYRQSPPLPLFLTRTLHLADADAVRRRPTSREDALREMTGQRAEAQSEAGQVLVVRRSLLCILTLQSSRLTCITFPTTGGCSGCRSLYSCPLTVNRLLDGLIFRGEEREEVKYVRGVRSTDTLIDGRRAAKVNSRGHSKEDRDHLVISIKSSTLPPTSSSVSCSCRAARTSLRR